MSFVTEAATIAYWFEVSRGVIHVAGRQAEVNSDLFFYFFYPPTYVRWGRVHVYVFPLVVCSYGVCAIVDGVPHNSSIFLCMVFFGSCKFVIVNEVLDFVVV